MENLLSATTAAISITTEIKEGRKEDAYSQDVKRRTSQGKSDQLARDGGVKLNGRWYMPPKYAKLRKKSVEEAHNTPYSMHPVDKLYKDLKRNFC